MARSLVLHPPAKINLMLRVGPLRADARHDVQTVLQSIAIGDTLTFDERRGPFALRVRGAGVPVDRTNLVWRAADALWRAMGRDGEPRDVHVRLDKTVPVGAGLGGGSADAAAALVGLNRLWRAQMPRATLVDIAATLGADVPFFLTGGSAIGLGRGDEIFPLDDVSRLQVIVIKPSISVATADAYRWFDEDAAAGEPRAPGRDLDVGWARPIAMTNDLQAPVVRRHPVVGEALSVCLREGAVAAAMTGSGSAVFGMFSGALGRAAARRLQRPDWLVLATRTLTRAEAGRRIGL